MLEYGDTTGLTDLDIELVNGFIEANFPHGYVGQEQFETFVVSTRPKRTAVQYDYRSTETGELFSIVRPALEQCRAKRHEWLKQKQLTH